ncbi:hypothetical protein GOBAR_DD05592 [Gossypium barbadense]|nr:hypothetical protein GOBAR_DD05592 [Gossypium barbadense]
MPRIILKERDQEVPSGMRIQVVHGCHQLVLLPVISQRKVRMMSSHHALYSLGNTRATMDETKGRNLARSALFVPGGVKNLIENMANFAKPENALKRAEEARCFAGVSQSNTFKEMQSLAKATRKDNVQICRVQVNVSSLEEVIKHFHLSTEKAEQARTQAQALQEALDFLWEAYRTVLEILRNNSNLEALYTTCRLHAVATVGASAIQLGSNWHLFTRGASTVEAISGLTTIGGELGAMTAHRAFQFCKQYKRTTEFRRLCEIIRNHLVNLNKYKDQRDRPDLSAPESLQLYLHTRFEQLKIATELGLWQEAFRSVEDIHGLMSIVKKTRKASLRVVYYAKLTEIFWISGSHLYHGYAWLKLFTLQKSFNKNLSQKDLQLIASFVILAALSVLPYDQIHGASHLELENEKERNIRMANLIGFNLETKLENREVFSRSLLLTELDSKGVLNCATQEVKDLYHLLEHDFLPLDSASKIQPLLPKISKPGGKLASASSVPEMSHVYQTMKIDSMSQIIPFFELFKVEKISIDAVKHKFIAMKVDHVKGVVLFGNMRLESDKLHDHLTLFAESLNKARAMIYPSTEKASKLSEVLPGLEEIVDKEHKILLARKSIIEKRKEEQERQLLEMEREEESKRQMLQKKTEEAEKKRLAAVFEQQRAERILSDSCKLYLSSDYACVQEKLTKQTLLEQAMSEQLKERQEQEKRLQKVAKTMDHLERAKREEAAPLIETAFQRRLVEQKVLHERERQLEVELSRQHHDGDLKEKNRLARMLENKAERRRKEEAEDKAKMDEIAEKQRQRERELAEKLSWEGQQRGNPGLLSHLLGPGQLSLGMLLQLLGNMSLGFGNKDWKALVHLHLQNLIGGLLAAGIAGVVAVERQCRILIDLAVHMYVESWRE